MKYEIDLFLPEAAEQRERLWEAAETSGVTPPMLGGKVTETDGTDPGRYPLLLKVAIYS